MFTMIGMGAGLAALGIIYLIGLIKRRAILQNAAGDRNERFFRLFYPAGILLWSWYEKAVRRRQNGPQREIRQKLRRLFVRDDVEEAYQCFQVKRFTIVWILAVAGLIVGLAVETAQLYRSGQEITNLDRPGAGESSKIYQLEAEGAWEGRKTAEFSVSPPEP